MTVLMSEPLNHSLIRFVKKKKSSFMVKHHCVLLRGPAVNFAVASFVTIFTDKGKINKVTGNMFHNCFDSILK